MKATLVMGMALAHTAGFGYGGISAASSPASPTASGASPAASSPTPSTKQARLRQYTFSWQFIDESTMAPRGGTTHGAPLQLDTEPTAEWKALQAPGLSAFEKDRRAILAMAGGYRASFDFIEVAGFQGAFKPSRPYQSWGTEKVYVIEDTGTSIKLQHLLVMSMVDKDGKVEGPFVTKHWRQDWQYEPKDQIVYQGFNTWQRVVLPKGSTKGQWRQTVYQVDDSPRYSGVAAWQHLGNHSSWNDAEGWRPLPRREFSVRKNYQVLIGNNRHIITPTGWIHEQQNLKVVLDKPGVLRQGDAVIARETGLNRYERLSGDFDWSAGDRYLKAAEPVWREVRRKWDALMSRPEPIRMKGAPDKDGLFVPLYEYADALNEDGGPQRTEAEIRRFVDDAVKAYLLP